jgi:transposase
MLALDPVVMEAVWQAMETYLPKRRAPAHPLGCHRRRRSDRDCFAGILTRLVTGCSWDVAARLSRVGETTLRRRRDEWVAAGTFDRLVDEALAGYDRVIGLDLEDVAVDGSTHKAPCGGEGTGPSPVDRGKTGWKWSLLTDRYGIPVGWWTDGANRHDTILFEPTLDAVVARGLLDEVATVHLDRGYDSASVRAALGDRGVTDIVCAKQTRGRTTKRAKKSSTLGLRWPVERTNSWLSNYGQLRRNTDRFIAHRLAQLALAITMILTVKLVKHARRWQP